jgi:UDP-N-acetylmuramoyl-L-alanyl-D-glutamate--2,6-diaminopimelate ligase
MAAHELLSRLSRQVGVEPRGDAELSGLTHDSRRIRPGWGFFAVPGASADGHLYAPAAVAAGAAALVVERLLDLDVPQLVVPSVRQAMGPLAAAFYGYPSEKLSVVGVTGTNGKTTTCRLLSAAMEAEGWRTGEIGTLGAHLPGATTPLGLTTPEAPDLQALLSDMAQVGVRGVGLEVSSVALDQARVDGTHFALGVFTGLRPEHLDYHGTLEHYYASKARLFEPRRCRQAVISIDTPWGLRLAAQARIPLITFGESSLADVRMEVRDRGLEGITVRLAGAGHDVVLPTRLIGRVNATNVAAAYLAARLLGVSPEAARSGIARCQAPSGRFEIIDAGQPYLVVVDFAHTPDALERLIATARGLAAPSGRLSVVVGHAGGRDRFNRQAMGHVAAQADRVVLTTDSPGDEDPLTILEQLKIGALLAGGREITVEVDRRLAIDAAISWAEADDVVLIVGRGHEQTQHFGSRSVHFDDRDEARQAIARRWVANRTDHGVVSPQATVHNEVGGEEGSPQLRVRTTSPMSVRDGVLSAPGGDPSGHGPAPPAPASTGDAPCRNTRDELTTFAHLGHEFDRLNWPH